MYASFVTSCKLCAFVGESGAITVSMHGTNNITFHVTDLQSISD
jgi:hypothetical protein